MNRRIRPSAALSFLEHRLEPLLELPPIFGAGHQRSHVEGEDRLVLQSLGHVTAHDPLGQSLHDRCLTNAWIAHQDGVVLGLARQDLDDAANLAVPADDRVKPPGPCLGHQVAPVLLERLVPGFRRRAGHTLGSADLGEDLEDPVALGAVFAQQVARVALRGRRHHGQQHVLDRHILVLDARGLALGRVEQARERPCDPGLTAGGPGTAHARLALERSLDGRSKRAGVDVGPRQQPRYQPFGLLEQREQQVKGVEFRVPVAQRLGLRVVQSLLGL